MIGEWVIQLLDVNGKSLGVYRFIFLCPLVVNKCPSKREKYLNIFEFTIKLRLYFLN